MRSAQLKLHSGLSSVILREQDTVMEEEEEEEEEGKEEEEVHSFPPVLAANWWGRMRKGVAIVSSWCVAAVCSCALVARQHTVPPAPSLSEWICAGTRGHMYVCVCVCVRVRTCVCEFNFSLSLSLCDSLYLSSPVIKIQNYGGFV